MIRLYRAVPLSFVLFCSAYAQSPEVKPEPVAVRAVHLLGIPTSAEKGKYPRDDLENLWKLGSDPNASDAQANELIDKIVSALNEQVDVQGLFEYLAKDLHVGDAIEQGKGRDEFYSTWELSVVLLKRAKADPHSNDAAREARAAFLLNCGLESSSSFSNSLLAVLSDSQYAGLLGLDKLDPVMKQQAKDTFTKWRTETLAFEDRLGNFLESTLDPISEQKGREITTQETSQILSGLTALSKDANDLTYPKYEFASQAASALQLARARNDKALDEGIVKIIDDASANTHDDLYRRWLSEAKAVAGKEPGALIGYILAKPDGTFVHGSRNADGKIVEQKLP